VELMGHRRYVGELSEVDVFGRRMGEVRHHNHDGTTQVVRFSGQAVYAVTDLTEAEFRAEIDATAARFRPLPAYRAADHDDDREADDSELERDMADARGEAVGVEVHRLADDGNPHAAAVDGDPDDSDLV
jgi:hypothetical protein